jgi:hypothetical protein
LGFPSFFLSHTSFSKLFETLPSLLCLRITYQQLEALQVLSTAFVGRREIAFCVGAMPGKDKGKSKNKERQKEHVPALVKATRGNVKKEDKKNIALVLEQSLQEEEKKKEQEVRSCQEEERSLAAALKLSLEEVSGDKNLPSVVPTGFFDRPDNYVMLDGKRTLSSASYLPINPRDPSPFQPWLMTPQGLKPVTLITLGPLNPGASIPGIEKIKSPKPSLNWGQGLVSTSQPQAVLSLLSPVVSTELPIEFSNSTKTERTDGTVTEVLSVLPQSDEPVVAALGESISSTLKVEDGVLNNSIPEVESGVRAMELEPPPSGSTDDLSESSLVDGDLGLSGSDVNSLRGSINGEVVGSNNSARSERSNSDSDWDVRKVCGMNDPDIKLEIPDASSSSATTSRSSNTASSSDSAKPMFLSQAAITKPFLESQS